MGNTKHIIVTDNFSKAMVLASLGVPKVKENGEPVAPGECWEWREISSDELDKNGFETVEDAEAAGFTGSIVYGFGEHPERKAIANAFEKAHRAANASAEMPDTLEIRDASGKKTTVKTVELMAAFGAVLFKNRKKFSDRRTKVRAKLHLNKGSGYAIIDRRAPAELKERFSK